ncbi:MAG: DNA repair protein RecO [Alphaproteobacteria bacterium]|nr:DNA repair protein RecO [Alphaproteobacteria bacterium]
MQWRDDGLLIGINPLNEDKLILTFFTRFRGLESGLIKRDELPLLLGSTYWIDCSLRIQESLGSFKLEQTKNYAQHFSTQNLLLVLGSLLDFLRLLLAPKDPHNILYDKTIEFLSKPVSWPNILVEYCRWELQLLKELGFGLSLEKCIVTRETSNLTYVSPKSGAAVSLNAGMAYKNQLLRLPKFLIEESSICQMEDIVHGLTLTGYFLEQKLFPQFGKAFPVSRQNLIQVLN